MSFQNWTSSITKFNYIFDQGLTTSTQCTIDSAFYHRWSVWFGNHLSCSWSRTLDIPKKPNKALWLFGIQTQSFWSLSASSRQSSYQLRTIYLGWQLNHLKTIDFVPCVGIQMNRKFPKLSINIAKYRFLKPFFSMKERLLCSSRSQLKIFWRQTKPYAMSNCLNFFSVLVSWNAKKMRQLSVMLFPLFKFRALSI